VTPREAALWGAWHYGWAWRHPDCLDDGQRQWVRGVLDAPGAHVWMIGRQRGKSYAALTLACCEALATPNTIIRYAALTGKSASAIVEPTLAAVAATIPPGLRPEVRADRGTVAFHNGSVLTWAGTDNEQFDRLRGPRAHLVLLDESAFYADLERVESALLPQLTTTQGRALYLSTPPESPAHPFVARYYAAQAAGRAVHAAVHDNPRLGPGGVARLEATEAQRLGLTLEALRASTYWRREYLAEIVTEESRAAVPAWTATRQSRLVVEVPRPEHFDGYVGVDLGFSPDPHGVLFGWLDFAAGTLVIEDEQELRSFTVAQLSEAIKARERALWGASRWDGTLSAAVEWADLPEWLKGRVHKAAPRQPYMRVGDDDKLVLAELAGSHGLAVLPTRKDDKHLAVDALNQLIIQERLRIHPRCVRLIEQLYSTVWNKRRSEWERTPKDHGDLVDALVYLVRNVAWHKDPRPPAPKFDYSHERQARGWEGLAPRRT